MLASAGAEPGGVAAVTSAGHSHVSRMSTSPIASSAASSRACTSSCSVCPNPLKDVAASQELRGSQGKADTWDASMWDAWTDLCKVPAGAWAVVLCWALCVLQTAVRAIQEGHPEALQRLKARASQVCEPC